MRARWCRGAAANYLKLLYLFTPRSCLEHLVAALYSHAEWMLAMLCICLPADATTIE